MTWRVTLWALGALTLLLAAYVVLRLPLFRRQSVYQEWNWTMDHVQRKLDGLVCDVYFFGSWSGYDHPVRPVKALMYEDAVQRSYYRAWMCIEGPRKTFVLLEGRRVSRSPFHGAVPALPNDVTEQFFSLIANGEEEQVGAPITADQSVDQERFLHVKRDDVGRPEASVVSVKMTTRFRYFYGPEGALSKAEITNFDGDVLVLTP